MVIINQFTSKVQQQRMHTELVVAGIHYVNHREGQPLHFLCYTVRQNDNPYSFCVALSDRMTILTVFVLYCQTE